jgi:hypothetical protein
MIFWSVLFVVKVLLVSSQTDDESEYIASSSKCIQGLGGRDWKDRSCRYKNVCFRRDRSEFLYFDAERQYSGDPDGLSVGIAARHTDDRSYWKPTVVESTFSLKKNNVVFLRNVDVAFIVRHGAGNAGHLTSEASLPLVYLSRYFNDDVYDPKRTIILMKDHHDCTDPLTIFTDKPTVCKKLTNYWLQPLSSFPLLYLSNLFDEFKKSFSHGNLTISHNAKTSFFQEGSNQENPFLFVNFHHNQTHPTSIDTSLSSTTHTLQDHHHNALEYLCFDTLLAGTSYMGPWAMNRRVNDEDHNIFLFRNYIQNYYHGHSDYTIGTDEDIHVVILHKTGRRVFLNHQEVVDHVNQTWKRYENHKIQFHVLDLAGISAQEQIEIFSKTSILISPFGSASYSSLYMPSYSTLIVGPVCEKSNGYACVNYDIKCLLSRVSFLHVDLYRIHNKTTDIIANAGNGFDDIVVSDFHQLDDFVLKALHRTVIYQTNKKAVSFLRVKHNALSAQLGVFANGNLLQLEDASHAPIFVMDNGKKRLVVSGEVVGGMNRDFEEVIRVSEEILNSIPNGEQVTLSVLANERHLVSP